MLETMNREQVYESTYLECADKVKGRLVNQLSNREDAEEVFQEAFLSFWLALEKFRGEAKPSTLLYGITRRRVADHLRRKYQHYRERMRALPDKQYVEGLEEAFHVPIDPLNVLIALTQDETRGLLLAIKRTRENQLKE